MKRSCTTGSIHLASGPWVGALFLAGCAFFFAGCAGSEMDLEDRPSVLAEQERMANFHYNLARQFWERDRKNLALRNLDLAVRRNPKAPRPWLAMLDIYLQTDDVDGALSCLNTCPEDLQSDPEFLVRKALALESKGQGQEAQLLLDRACSESDYDPTLWIAAADNLLLQGRQIEALDKLEEARRFHPGEARILQALVALYQALGRYHEAAKCIVTLIDLDEILDDSCLKPDPKTLLSAAEFRMRAGQYLEAAELCSSVLDMEPDHRLARAALSFAYLRAGLKEESRQVIDGAPNGIECGGLLDAVSERLKKDGNEDQSF